MSYCSQCGSELPGDARFCPKCGAAAPGAEATSAPPPAPTPTPTPTPAQAFTPVASSPGGGGAIRFVLPAIIVVAVAVIAFVFLTQRDGARPIAGNDSAATAEKSDDGEAVEGGETADRSAGDVTRTSAASLDSAFNSDPQGAAERYPGPVRVTGTIATMVSPGPTPSLSLEGRTRFNFMIVNFPDGYRTRLAPLAKGQTITVDCTTIRTLGGTTILDGCTLD